MIYLVFAAVAFLASVIGAICGIGGGVIIKPVLDMVGILDVKSINFFIRVYGIGHEYLFHSNSQDIGGIFGKMENSHAVGFGCGGRRIAGKGIVSGCQPFFWGAGRRRAGGMPDCYDSGNTDLYHREKSDSNAPADQWRGVCAGGIGFGSCLFFSWHWRRSH